MAPCKIKVVGITKNEVSDKVIEDPNYVPKEAPLIEDKQTEPTNNIQPTIDTLVYSSSDSKDESSNNEPNNDEI